MRFQQYSPNLSYRSLWNTVNSIPPTSHSKTGPEKWYVRNWHRECMAWPRMQFNITTPLTCWCGTVCTARYTLEDSATTYACIITMCIAIMLWNTRLDISVTHAVAFCLKRGGAEALTTLGNVLVCSNGNLHVRAGVLDGRRYVQIHHTHRPTGFESALNFIIEITRSWVVCPSLNLSVWHFDLTQLSTVCIHTIYIYIYIYI